MLKIHKSKKIHKSNLSNLTKPLKYFTFQAHFNKSIFSDDYSQTQEVILKKGWKCICLVNEFQGNNKLLVLNKLFLHIRNPKWINVNEFVNEILLRSNEGLMLNPSKGLLEMWTYQLTVKPYSQPKEQLVSVLFC